MDIKAYKKQLEEMVIIPMKEYAKEVEDCGFSKKDIKKCEALILQYLTALEKLRHPGNQEIMEQVEHLVLALNQLNEDTDYCMIETSEREAIWEIIQESAVDCGLTDPADDITEEWREW